MRAADHSHTRYRRWRRRDGLRAAALSAIVWTFCSHARTALGSVASSLTVYGRLKGEACCGADYTFVAWVTHSAAARISRVTGFGPCLSSSSIAACIVTHRLPNLSTQIDQHLRFGAPQIISNHLTTDVHLSQTRQLVSQIWVHRSKFRLDRRSKHGRSRLFFCPCSTLGERGSRRVHKAAGLFAVLFQSAILRPQPNEGIAMIRSAVVMLIVITPAIAKPAGLAHRLNTPATTQQAVADPTDHSSTETRAQAAQSEEARIKARRTFMKRQEASDVKLKRTIGGVCRGC